MATRLLFSLCILPILGVLIYSNSFEGSFVFDDIGFIVNNLAIRNLGDFSFLWELLSQPSRFVGFVSLSLDYHFYQLSPVGYHLTNILIHILTSLLVYCFVKLILSTEKFKESVFKKNSDLLSICAAVIFIAHPVQTQAVTYISQRFASLATLFYLASLCSYVKGRLVSSKKFSLICFLCTALFGLLGMFTKEIVITLPIMIFVTELFFLKQNANPSSIKNLKRWFFCIPLFLSLSVIPAIFSFNFKSFLFAKRISESHDGDILTLGPYLLTQLRVAVQFLKLLVLPLGQNLDYDFPASFNFFEIPVLTSLLVLIITFVAGIYWRKRSPLLFYGIMWFFITFSANLAPRRHVIFEHKLYLISVGFCIFVTIGLFQLLKDKRKFIVGIALMVSILSLLTFQRNKVWKNEISLWSDVVKKSPNKQRPHINLGSAYLAKKEYEKAIKHLSLALKVDRPHAKGHLNRGVAFAALGEYDLALHDYNAALEIEEKFDEAYINRGILFALKEQNDLALLDFNKAIFMNPKVADSYFNRGNVYKGLGELDLALSDYSRALFLNDSHSGAYRDRGVIYLRKGQYERAMSDFEKAIKLKASSLDRVYSNRGIVYLQSGQYVAAINNFERALSINPQLESARHNLEYVRQRIKKSGPHQ